MRKMITCNISIYNRSTFLFDFIQIIENMRHFNLRLSLLNISAL